jgi:hypothetical protein
MKERAVPDQTSPEPITYYWLATIITDSGKQITTSSTVPTVPGMHTRMTTMNAVMKHLKEQYGNYTVVFLDLAPNHSTVPA